MNSPQHNTHARDTRSDDPTNGAGQERQLLWCIALILGLAAIEAIGGWWAGSLALLSDAAHMLSDATALGLAAFAAFVSRKPASSRHSYGLLRAEVVAALVNGIIMLGVVASIGWHAFERLQNPIPVAGWTVVLIALAGLTVNVIVAWLLHRGEQTLNIRGALLHVIGDLLGSIAALISGIVIILSGWTPIDPLLSFLICALILVSSVRLLRDVLHVLMEGVPPHLDLPEIGRTMASRTGVREVHDLHIWTVSSGMTALSAHIVIDDMGRWEDILGEMQALLHDRYQIEHVTLQPEPAIRTTRIVRM